MSFRLKTILGIALIEGVLLLLLVWMGLNLMHGSHETELMKRASTSATLFATTTKDAVLSSDLASLESFVDEVLKNPGMVYARVVDRDGTVLAERGDGEALKRPFVADRHVDDAKDGDGVFDVFAKIREGGTVYGHVQLGLDIAGLYRLLAEARTKSAGVALLEMGLVALFSFVLGTYLTRQLKSLKDASRRIAAGDLGCQIEVRGGDELAQTAEAFNHMSRRLRQFADELEARVAKRTAELSQAQEQLKADIARREQVEADLRLEKEQQRELIDKLEQAHNQLLQSEKLASIGQLVAGVAHEINNPVGYVSLNLGVLQRYLPQLLRLLKTQEAVLAGDGESRDRIEVLKAEMDLDFLRQDISSLLGESQEGIGRIKQIIQDLRDFSHVGEAEWQWADLHKGLDSTLNIVRNETKYKADVVKEYGDLPSVECLVSQLNQVFMNLLVNAAQSIERRGVITVRTGMEGNDWVWIEIADTGKGIPAEDLKRIFDPFFTTKAVGVGTGLGLSLSYGIVQKHGGHVDVKSEVGSGTTFRVWLPVEQAVRAVSSEQRAASRKAVSNQWPVSNKERAESSEQEEGGTEWGEQWIGVRGQWNVVGHLSIFEPLMNSNKTSLEFAFIRVHPRFFSCNVPVSEPLIFSSCSLLSDSCSLISFWPPITGSFPVKIGSDTPILNTNDH